MAHLVSNTHLLVIINKNCQFKKGKKKHWNFFLMIQLFLVLGLDEERQNASHKGYFFARWAIFRVWSCKQSPYMLKYCKVIYAFKRLLQPMTLYPKRDRFVQGVCLTLFIFMYYLTPPIFDQISHNMAYLTENTLKFYILSKK